MADENTDLDAGALDVMDAALAGESPTSNQGIADEGTQHDDDTGTTPEEGAEAIEDAEAEVKAETPEEKAAAGRLAGRERNPDGTLKPKAAVKAPEVDPATGKPKVEAAKQPEIDPATGKPKVEQKKEPDAINDPLPKDLKAETRARVEKLIDIAKEKTTQYEQVQESLNAVVTAVQNTGSTPEQYGELLSWMGLFNSPDTAQKEKALELAQSVVERLSTMLGKPLNYNNPIAGHADLIAEMQQGKLTPQRAQEIAIQRNQQKLNGETQQYQQQQQTQAQQFEQAQEEARSRLTDLGKTLEATDPDYAAKKDRILPALKEAFKSVPPQQWAGMFERAYRNVVLPKAAPTAAPRNQPLRANRNGSGGGGAPTTPITDPLAVMNAALSSMR